MRYFEEPNTTGNGPNGHQVVGYDDTHPYFTDLIADAVAAKWNEVTGNWPLPASITAADLKRWARTILDSQAQAKNYDDANTCIGYANSSNAVWAADAVALSKFRDDLRAYETAQEGAVPLPDQISFEDGCKALPSYPGW